MVSKPMLLLLLSNRSWIYSVNLLASQYSFGSSLAVLTSFGHFSRCEYWCGFTPLVISLRALFCVVSRAFRVELLAVISTSLPYFMTGLMYVLYVVFIVSCVLPHVALASRFISLSL